MELFLEGDWVREGGIGDFPLNAYHVKDDLEIGSGKASMRSLLGSLSGFKHQYRLKPQPKSGLFGHLSELEQHPLQLKRQPKSGLLGNVSELEHPSQLKRPPKSGFLGNLSELENEYQRELRPKRGCFDLNSERDESNNDNNVFPQFQESLKTQQFNMVQNHVVPFEEGDVMMEELTPTPIMVDDLVFSSKEGDVVMDDFAVPLNTVYNHVSFEKGDVIMEELAPIPYMVPDHVVSSDARDVIMEDVTPAPVSLPDHVLSYQEGYVCNEEGEDADDEGEEEELPAIIRPLGVMFSSSGSCIPWTP